MNSIALEAQVVRELRPAAVVRAAAAAGFDMVGIFIDLTQWNGETTREVRNAFADTGIAPLDAEVIRLQSVIEDDHRRLIDIASEVGMTHIITVAMADDISRTADLLAELGAYGAAAGVRPVLEFGRFSAIAGIDEAIRATARALGLVGILPDPIHLKRSGGVPADMARLPAHLVAYAQICDAGPPPADMSAAGLLQEARHHRRDLGAGDLPLADFYRMLPPGIPLSNEVRSLDLERRYPDPFERADAVAKNTRRWLAEHGEA